MRGKGWGCVVRGDGDGRSVCGGGGAWMFVLKGVG